MPDNGRHGVKRKRLEVHEEDLGVRISRKLHHNLKEIRKAAKKAKAFETQKLVKKLKDLRKKGDNALAVSEQESQLSSLKDVEHDEIGSTALKSKIMKDRMLSENEHVQTAVTTELSSNLLSLASPGTPLAKVQSRLLSSKIVAAEVSSTIEALRNLLQPKFNEEDLDMEDGTEQAIASSSKKKKTSPAEVYEMDVDAEGILEEAGESESREDAVEDLDDVGGEVDETGWESGTIGDDENEADDGWESGPLDGGALSSGDEEDETGSKDDDDKEPLRVPVLKKPIVAPKAAKAKVNTSVTQSTFLPSLAVGFVPGSDDSDWSDGEGKVADVAEKKNRRGQRARRAIWEKKFGKNANHKKKEAAEESNTVVRGKGVRGAGDTIFNSGRTRNAPVGPASNARSQRKDDSVPQNRQQPDSGWGQRTPGPTQSFGGGPKKPAPQPQRGEERGLHPSWEAKRRLKEKESAGIIPSQGKKIKFS